MTRTCALFLAILAAGSLPASAGPSFTPIGELSGGATGSAALGVSADGSVVVGQSWGPDGLAGIQWTKANGLVTHGANTTAVYDISADGVYAVGSTNAAGDNGAFRSVNGSSSYLPHLNWSPSGSFSSVAYGLSGDGSRLVGNSTGTSTQGFYWTSNSGVQALSGLPAKLTYSEAFDISSDGLVAVGRGESGTSKQEAIYWNWSGGPTGTFGSPTGLGDLPGGTHFSVALGASADGSVIVGSGTSASGTEAFRWTSSGGMVGLGELSGGSFRSVANDVSGDGSIVVGVSNSALGQQAFLWTQSGGMISIRDYLTNAGMGSSITGWNLQDARAISTDGRTIVGFGVNPLGKNEGWVVTIPEPSTYVMAALAMTTAVVLGVRRRRRTPT